MKKILVLVIDDDQSVVDFLVACLRTGGYNVETACGGRQGLEMARRMKPNLVILDLLMPGMHGFEVCQALRREESLRDVKILASTGKTYPTDRKSIMQLGADGFLAKPYSSEQLLEAVEGLVGGGGIP